MGGYATESSHRKRIAIIVAIVRIPFPVSRQPDRVRLLLEPAVAEQLGMQAELDVLEHELGELTVEARIDAVLDRRRVDRDGRLVVRLAAQRRDQGDGG